MAGWHHRLKGQESEQALRSSEGQGSLACCTPWGHKGSDTTEPLNNSSNDPQPRTVLLKYFCGVKIRVSH